MLKYFTIMYDKNTMVTSIFEKKKKRHLQGTDRTLVTERESETRAQLTVSGWSVSADGSHTRERRSLGGG